MVDFEEPTVSGILAILNQDTRPDTKPYLEKVSNWVTSDRYQKNSIQIDELKAFTHLAEYIPYNYIWNIIQKKLVFTDDYVRNILKNEHREKIKPQAEKVLNWLRSEKSITTDELEALGYLEEYFPYRYILANLLDKFRLDDFVRDFLKNEQRDRIKLQAEKVLNWLMSDRYRDESSISIRELNAIRYLEDYPPYTFILADVRVKLPFTDDKLMADKLTTLSEKYQKYFDPELISKTKEYLLDNNSPTFDGQLLTDWSMVGDKIRSAMDQKNDQILEKYSLTELMEDLTEIDEINLYLLNSLEISI